MDNLSSEPVAKPWYMSKTILSLIAGILLASLVKFGNALGIDLPDSLNNDSMVQFLSVVIPMLLAIAGRVVAKRTVTSTADKAEVKNTAAIISDTTVPIATP